MSSAYRELEERFRSVALLEDAQNLLHWDASTYMPDHAAEARAEQAATLSALRHRLMTEERLGGLLEDAAAHTASLGEWQQANLREMRRHFVHSNCLEARLVEKLSRVCLESEHRWFTARAENDFAAMKPYFEHILVLTREAAAAKAEVLGCGAYDALLDQYDPGLRMAAIDACFIPLAERLPGLIDTVLERQGVATDTNLSAPVTSQETLGRAVLEALGFDFSALRLDTSPHPFCGGARGDIRITSRYNPEDFTEGLFGVLHESGHALYERQLPRDWRYQPVGDARGMSLHESQSLLVEMQLGQSRAFVNFLLPLIERHLGKSFSSSGLYAALTRVERGLIRVTADEVTYPAHILLRYDLEKRLLSGDLPVGDLPEAWAEGMERLLGIRPDTDRDGCLQDIHWPGGAFGYFPTYTLGALIAAQLMEAARNALPELDAQVARGEFAPLQRWLGERVHAPASRFHTTELVEGVTGKPLGIAAYLRYIERKYLEKD